MMRKRNAENREMQKETQDKETPVNSDEKRREKKMKEKQRYTERPGNGNKDAERHTDRNIWGQKETHRDKGVQTEIKQKEKRGRSH